MLRVTIVAILIVAVTSEIKTECEEHRDRESQSNAPLPLRLIPECDENGDYKAMQCFQDSDFCACWDKGGDAITQPSRKIKACECLLMKHELRKRGPLRGAYNPECTEDGKYHPVQCHASTGLCWCANPETGERLSEQIRGQPDC